MGHLHFMYQLRNRAITSESAIERHQAGFYLWEFGLRILASVSMIRYSHTNRENATVSRCIENIARPSLGQWWELTKHLVRELAESGDEDFELLSKTLFEKSHDSLFDAIKLDAFLKARLLGQNSPKSQSYVRLDQLFERMIQYRNKEVHGFLGGREKDFYEDMSAVLLPAVWQIWSLIDVLASQRLHFIQEVRGGSDGNFRVLSWDLSSEERTSNQPLTVRKENSALLPLPNRLYLGDEMSVVNMQGLNSLQLIFPLASYEFEADELYLYGGTNKQKDGVNLVGCSTGAHSQEVDIQHQCRIFSQLLRTNVTAGDVNKWAERSTAEEATDNNAVPLAEVAADRKRIGEFELLSRIGSGSFGTVYRAWQPALRREVALKRLSNSGKVEQRARFSREIEALGRVDHPHLVKVFQSGIDGDDCYYAMELIEGVDLGRVLGQLSGAEASQVDSNVWQSTVSTVCDAAKSAEVVLDELMNEESPGRASKPIRVRASVNANQFGDGHVKHVVRLIRDIADALQCLHDAKVIHRDIKPSNIMITPQGEAVLMDLGLAQLADAETLTQSRQFVGTIRYCSPEQAFSSKAVDFRSDVYSLGATFWELLTLRPFLGINETIPPDEQFKKIRLEEPEGAHKYNAHVPRDLSRIVAKCVEKNETRRYRSMADLIEDINRWLSGAAVLAQDPSLGYLFAKSIKKHRRLAASLGGILVSIIVATISAFVFVESARRDAVKIAEKLNDTLDDKSQLTEGLERQLYSTHIAIAERELTSNHDFGLAEQLLSSCPETQRGWEWNYLKCRLDGPRPPLTGHKKGLWTAEYSADGSKIVTASIDGTIKVWSAKNGEKLHDIMAQPSLVLFGGFEVPIAGAIDAMGQQAVPIMCASFSPDGKLIASGSFAPTYPLNNDNSPGVVTLWDSETGKKVREYRDHTGVVMALCFTPDGSSIASSTINEDHTFDVWDIKGAKLIKRLNGHKSVVHRIRFSPNGEHMFSVDTIGRVIIWNAKTFEIEQSIQAHSAPIIDICYDSNTDRFATASEDGSIRIWDRKSGNNVLDLRGHMGSALGVSFSPDGKLIASGGFDRTVRLWDAITGQPRLSLRGHADMIWSVMFSPDGTQILSASYDKTARIWDSKIREERSVKPASQFFGHKERCNCISISPDGNKIASGSWDASVRLWDTSTKTESKMFSDLSSAVWTVDFSRSGSMLAAGAWDGRVCVWNHENGIKLADLDAHSAPAHCLTFSNDGKSLVSAGFDGKIISWDTSTWEANVKFETFIFPIFSVCFSKNDKYLYSAGTDRKITCWNAKTGKRICEIGEHDAAVSKIRIDSTGTRMVSAAWDKTAKLWDISEPGPKDRLLFTITGNADRVNAAAISPSGHIIATASDDKTVRFWSTADGTEIGSPRFHRAAVWDVYFSPDEKTISTAAWTEKDGLYTWDIQDLERTRRKN